MIQSAINEQLTENYIWFEKENQKFDRKSAKKDIKEIANHIAGFANADGGTLVIGITDDGKLEELEIIEWIGTNTNDPKKRYILKR